MKEKCYVYRPDPLLVLTPCSSTVSWGMECRDQGQVVKSTGKVTYAGSSFTGSSQTTVDHPGQGKMKINSQMSGKRIGNCK